jgi:hypothetical protein
MTKNTTGNLQITDLKTYVPSQNFKESKQFYLELGFELTEAWGGNVDCKRDNAQFRLQNYYVKTWADNFTLQFGVKDARAWYEHVKPIVESGRYKNVRVSEPEEVEGDIITRVWDPCGVLLIFIE